MLQDLERAYMEAEDYDVSMVSPCVTAETVNASPITYAHRPRTWREFTHDRNVVSTLLADNMSAAAEEVVVVQELLKIVTQSDTLAQVRARVWMMRSRLRAATKILRDDGGEEDETEDVKQEE